jgi:hypothetical protein
MQHYVTCCTHRFDDAAGVLEQALGNSDSVEHHTSSSANNSHADVADLASDVETLILLSQVRVYTAICLSTAFSSATILDTVNVRALTTFTCTVLSTVYSVQYHCIQIGLCLSTDVLIRQCLPIAAELSVYCIHNIYVCAHVQL